MYNFICLLLTRLVLSNSCKRHLFCYILRDNLFQNFTLELEVPPKFCYVYLYWKVISIRSKSKIVKNRSFLQIFKDKVKMIVSLLIVLSLYPVTLSPLSFTIGGEILVFHRSS